MANTPCKVVVIEHLTLDGVYQAPARADEDTRNNFKHGGWSMAGADPQMQQIIGKSMAGGWSLLAGRTTYEDLFEGWQVRQPSHPMTQALTDVQKFVASQNPNYKHPWKNSILLEGEATEAVAKLKKEHDKTLIVFGSGLLVHSLMQHGLVDEMILMIHPVVLGEGFRFFDQGTPFTRLKLQDKIITGTGVILANYQCITG